jgi:hypothetical protein
MGVKAIQRGRFSPSNIGSSVGHAPDPPPTLRRSSPARKSDLLSSLLAAHDVDEHGVPVGFGRWIGDFIKPVRADPCDLGGSDLETKPISYAVTVIAGPEVGKLFRKTGPAPEPDTTEPLAFLGSEPLPGGQVSEGDTIVIEITADDRSSVDSIVTGIASVTLATDTGQQVDGWEFEGPVACDKDRLRRVVRLEYLVPENPPELVKLVATVKDYEGHETKLEATYPNVGLWTGYMDVTGGQTTDPAIGGSHPCAHAVSAPTKRPTTMATTPPAHHDSVTRSATGDGRIAVPDTNDDIDTEPTEELRKAVADGTPS